jgi:hypothetical protein
MIAILVGVALTAALLTALARRGGLNAADKGSMSSNWVAANRAGERGGSSL